MKTLIDQYIDKQALRSAIERFSDQHDNHHFAPQQKVYRELIPSTKPGPGQQYAFEVDLDKCTGCKACVSACHHENGLDVDETWRSVGLLHGGSGENPAIQHVTSACHHCMEPACMTGCPTQAYVKDPETGIVKHLEDQCFGCQYCILTCAYDVPKYNAKRGIVHKCDMCLGRLKAGQAPACVRACPNDAIRITLVEQMHVKSEPSAYVNVPGAPPSNYTFPTTKYLTKKTFPSDMESADYYTVKPEHSHGPLVAMLVLTQLSVGAFASQWLLRKYLQPDVYEIFWPWQASLALGIGLLALVSSVFHLGRPHLAFRAVLGFRTSWLSREIIAFGLFAQLALFYTLVSWMDPLKEMLLRRMGEGFISFLAGSVTAAGVLGIFCSVMVYARTRRPFWNTPLTGIKFFLTTVILGSAAVFLMISGFEFFHPDALKLSRTAKFLFITVIWLGTVLKCLVEAGIFLHLRDQQLSSLKKTALLMTGPLKIPMVWRFLCGLIGGVGIPLIVIDGISRHQPSTVFVFSVLMMGLTLAAEALERYLFFRAVVPLKISGGQKS